MIRDMIEGVVHSPGRVRTVSAVSHFRLQELYINDQAGPSISRCAVPNSLLFLGRPGVGKTTVIREMARVLADDLHKRVVIVDTRCNTLPMRFADSGGLALVTAQHE